MSRTHGDVVIQGIRPTRQAHANHKHRHVNKTRRITTLHTRPRRSPRSREALTSVTTHFPPIKSPK
ncbi:hypothetical protein BD410DRAFT_794913 [Rickenella mellea]|uniref:Uncharacterized protein n=1 Tax=Rickenella mellea TaxID=50990 RepID=A0A4Y7PN19_9AGAM|nr:hypothetical protein BD410DRAFT_794913 [Rickenella mellea]